MRVSLLLEDVLESVKDKSLEQKYGYLQATYGDLYSNLTQTQARVRELEAWGKSVPQKLKAAHDPINMGIISLTPEGV